VKRSGTSLRWDWGVAYVHQWAAWNRLPWLAPLLVLVRARQLPWILAAASNLVWAWSVGGDFMAWSRFLVPATACLAMLVVGLCLELEVLACTRGRAHVGLAVALTLIVASSVLVPFRIKHDREGKFIHGISGARYESVALMDRFAATRFAAGRWLRANVAPTTRISVGAAGALPYGSGVYVIDAYGLVDVALAKASTPLARPRPGHQRHATVAKVLTRDPDLVCHVGEVTPTRPSHAMAVRRVGPGWTWACIPTGPFSTLWGEHASTNYCCLRRADHVVPPFGALERDDEAARAGAGTSRDGEPGEGGVLGAEHDGGASSR
jgi:arabinofuranosyltransferase